MRDLPRARGHPRKPATKALEYAVPRMPQIHRPTEPRIFQSLCAEITMRFSSLMSAILLVNCLYGLAGAENQPVKSDLRVRIVSPAPGTIFAPGDRVSVELAADPSLQPDLCDVSVGSSGMGFMDCATQFLRFPVHCSGVIPEEFAGPVTLTAEFYKCRGERSEESYSELYSSEPVTIGVRPKESPKEIFIESFRDFQLPGDRGRTDPMRPVGIYANGLQRNLQASVAGTRYNSNRPEVATVDSEGNVQPVNPGITIVTVEHRGVKAFTIIRVDDQTRVLPPEDVTDAFDIDLGNAEGFKDQDTYANLRQEVRVKNRTSLPVPGQLLLVLTNVAPGILPVSMGKTKTILPAGSPMDHIPCPTTGGSILPNESVTVALKFWGKEGAPVSYTARIFRADVQ